MLGFAVTVCGTSLYNEILRACLPSPPAGAAAGAAAAAGGERSGRGRSREDLAEGGGEADEARRPLLGAAGEGAAAAAAAAALQASPAPAALVAGSQQAAADDGSGPLPAAQVAARRACPWRARCRRATRAPRSQSRCAPGPRRGVPALRRLLLRSLRARAPCSPSPPPRAVPRAPPLELNLHTSPQASGSDIYTMARSMRLGPGYQALSPHALEDLGDGDMDGPESYSDSQGMSYEPPGGLPVSSSPRQPQPPAQPSRLRNRDGQ